MAHLFRAQHALHRLQAVSAFRSGRQLTPEEGIEAGDFYREVVAAAAAGELLAVTEEQKHAFARSLVAVVSPMPSLEQPLQAALRGPRPSQAACGQLLAAADVLSGGALLLSELHLSGEVATALVVGGSLLVAAGTPLLSQLVSRSQVLLLLPGQASSAAPGITGLLNAAAVLAGAVLPLGREAPHTAARRALLKGAFAPRRILPFLAAMLAAVQAAAADPSDAARTYPVAVRLLVHLLEGKECAKQQAALLADRSLVERLLMLLRHSLAAAADSSNSAAADLPGASLALQLLFSGLAAALTSPPVSGQLQRLLRSDAGAALATVRDAAAVLRQLPLQLQSVGAQELWSAHGSAACLLGRLVCLLPGRPPPATRDVALARGPPPPPEVERPPLLRQVGQVAVDTLPALAAAAAALARLVAERQGSPQQGSRAAPCLAPGPAIDLATLMLIYEQYQQIVLATTDAPVMSTADELLAWVAAADAMLRLLPVPAELAAELAALPPGAQPVPNHELAAQMVHRCMGVFGQAATTGRRFLPSLDAAAQQAIADDVLPALTALHSRACRLVHWSQAGGPQRSALVGSWQPNGWHALANRVAAAFLNAANVLQAKLAALEDEGTLDSLLGQDIRLMHASLCAAHLEAMAVLARCAGPLAFVGATRLLDSIAVALAGAPAQSLFTPAADSLHNLLHKLLSREELPGWGLPHRADLLTMLLWTGAASPPHVAAALLPSIAVVLQEVAAAPPPASFGDEAGMVELYVDIAGITLLVIADAHGQAFGRPDQAKWLAEHLPPEADHHSMCGILVALLPAFEQMVTELLSWWQRPEQLVPARLAAGRAAAVRACAYLACPNVGAEGGMVAGQGAGCKRCGGCRSVWYCGPACSRADWKQHKLVCPLLKADHERQAVSPMG